MNQLWILFVGVLGINGTTRASSPSHIHPLSEKKLEKHLNFDNFIQTTDVLRENFDELIGPSPEIVKYIKKLAPTISLLESTLKKEKQKEKNLRNCFRSRWCSFDLCARGLFTLYQGPNRKT